MINVERFNSRKLGATLLEMIIVLGIVSIILLSVARLVRVSVDYYFYSTAQLEVQRNALLSLNLLSQQLTASTYESVYTDNNLPHPGIVFASPRDASGELVRDGSGNLVWTRLICYYIDTVNGQTGLVRKEFELTVQDTNPPDPVALGADITYFRNLPTPGRFMARGITKLSTSELTDALEITITSEVNQGNNWLEMDVATTIVPRN